MENDAWFFVGLFVFIFIIWIATGGPLRPPKVDVPATPNLTLTGSSTFSGTKTYLGLPRSPYAVGDGQYVCLPGSTSCNGGIYTNTGTGGTPGTPGSTPVPSGVPGVILTAPSPYRNMVSMSSYVGNASSSDPKTEYVQISLAQNASGPVDITNWVLRSGATGKAEIIPKGTAVPTSGVVNATDDIVLQPGDSATIISGKSPVGASFRENKCIGYFNGFQQFSPSLPTNCPSASDELTAFYGTPYIHDPFCIDYTKSLSRCQTALPTPSANLTLTCQDFLENHLNYNSCLNLHRGDSDFNGHVWHIYLGRKSLQEVPAISSFNSRNAAGPLWRSRYEVVQLLDGQGKTVATFNY